MARIIVQLESRFYNIYRFIFTIMTTFASVEYQEIEGIFVFTFTGEIDETNADEIFKKIYNIFSGRFIIFNFSGLTYGNSKFLGYVASMYEYIWEKEGDMVICECGSAVSTMFDIAGIFLIIPATNTLEEALVKIGATV